MRKSRNEIDLLIYCRQFNSKSIHGSEIEVECVRVDTEDLIRDLTDHLTLSDFLDEYDLDVVEEYVTLQNKRIELGLTRC